MGRTTMAAAEQTEIASESKSQQINDLFDSLELAKAIDTEEFKLFLDHVPIAIIISKLIRGDQRIVFANKTYEDLTGQALADIRGKGWTILDSFVLEDDPHVTFSQTLPKGEDFVGTFRREQPKPALVEAYAGLIENEDGTENYRIVALIDVTERERAQREEFARQIRDKDLVLKEIQHRVRNNLQLVAALIRLEARNERRGVVGDDGVGLPTDTVWPVPGKIGALIVQTLRENTKTDLNVETAAGKGTRVTMSFIPQVAKHKAN
jgi:PAS domain S-box-containing protein